MDIRIEKTTAPKSRPDEQNLGFGRTFTDHMFLMKYTEGKGWHDAAVVPYAPFMLDPACMVYHYAQECFEGMKAYRTESGDVQLFRPDRNAARMASTHKRLCIPEIPQEDFVQAVKTLVSVDKDWVPSSPGTSLYIRPFTIATEPHLGVKPSDSYLFCVILSPSGAYYSSGFAPVKIYVENELTRSSVGGTGFIKCGGNYANSLYGQEKAHKLGYSQVLWLDSVHRRYVEEVGSMNCFFVVEDTIYTAPLTQGTVLPGITRESCIELLRGKGYTVKEEALAIDDILQYAKEGKLREIFGTGTAAVVSPVGEIRYKDDVIKLCEEPGEITMMLYDTLTGIQYGRLPDTKGWICAVE